MQVFRVAWKHQVRDIDHYTSLASGELISTRVLKLPMLHMSNIKDFVRSGPDRGKLHTCNKESIIPSTSVPFQ